MGAVFIPQTIQTIQRVEGNNGVQQAFFRYDLYAFTIPGGLFFYFMSAYRKSGRAECFHVSPVLDTHPARARQIFLKIARAAEAVHPIHLVDIVEDVKKAGPLQPWKVADLPIAEVNG